MLFAVLHVSGRLGGAVKIFCHVAFFNSDWCKFLHSIMGSFSPGIALLNTIIL